jgi:nucleotide-binding universal stress UspA family protein
MKEAAIRHLPLTVLTVHEAIRGYYSGVALYPDDTARTEEARQAAQAETDKVLAGLDGRLPESVTVKAVHGFPVEELNNAGKDADMTVLGSRGAAGRFGRRPGGGPAGRGGEASGADRGIRGGRGLMPADRRRASSPGGSSPLRGARRRR